MKGKILIIINDTCIYDSYTAEDYLSSLGMDNEDIAALQKYLNEKYHTHTTDYWKQEAKEWERESAREFELRNSLICEVQNLADELASGKGGTKARYAEKFKSMCEYYA